jgi:heme-degrading monooxygenase HmoA
MYLVNEILVFAPGRHKEAIDRLEYIHGLMAGAPGFRVGLVGKYLGGATRHTVLRFWEDEAAYQAFRAGPNGNYGRNRPEGLYTNEPVVPAWNEVVEVPGDAQGAFLVKVQRDVPEDAWEAYGGWL